MTLELSPRSIPDDRDPATLVRRAKLRPDVDPHALVRYLAALPAARRAFTLTMFSEPLPEAQFLAALQEELGYHLGPGLFAEVQAMFDRGERDRALDLARSYRVPRETYTLRRLREAVEPRPIRFRRITGQKPARPSPPD